MSDKTLKVLEDAGIAVDRLPDEERAVLETLSPEELSVLANVHQKMDAVSEVTGQHIFAGGVLF